MEPQAICTDSDFCWPGPISVRFLGALFHDRGDCPPLQQIPRQLCQDTALAFNEVDVGEELLAAHLVDKVGQAIGEGIEVGRIDLLYVAGKDHLGAFPRAGDDGFDLVRGKVLGFINDEKDVREAAAADIGQRRDEELFGFSQFFDVLVFLARGLEFSFDDGEVVEEGLHVGPNLLAHVAGQEADVAVGQGDDGAGKEYLLELGFLREGCSEGEEGLAGAGLARKRDELDTLAGKGVEGECLFGVSRFDAVTALFFHAVDELVRLVVVGEGARGLAFKDKVLVGQGLFLEGKGRGLDALVVGVELGDEGAFEPFELLNAVAYL